MHVTKRIGCGLQTDKKVEVSIQQKVQQVLVQIPEFN